MTQPLFEQYKAALRRGHVAVLGGDLASAVEAYREAARLVPDRALPLASLGTVLYRMGRPGEAEAAFETALRIAPDDEATLQTRAGARREVGLVADAAADLERLALILEASGRRAAALSHASNAQLLAPSPARAALVERLSGPDQAQEPAGFEPAPERGAAREAAGDVEPDAVAEPDAAAEPDAEQLVAEAAGLVEAGHATAARDLLLRAEAIHRAAGRPDAALDACFLLLGVAPADPAVHLAIAGLQLDRGWQSLAADKVALLLRLTALTGDTQAAADAHALVAERLRDEPSATAAAAASGPTG